MDLEKFFIAVIIIVPVAYFWVFWINPMTIKKILTKKGYDMEYIRAFLKRQYTNYFYEWIPKLLLK